MTHRLARTLLLSASFAMVLSGCVRFGTKPPPQLLTISPDARVAPGARQSSVGSRRLVVTTPEAVRPLATVRVPVRVDAGSIAYVKEAQWSEPPRVLFQRLLIETLSADNSYFVSDASGVPIGGARILSGDLVEFGLDAQSRTAVVTFDASLSDPAEPGQEPRIVRQRFSASAPVGKIEADTVAAPLGVAANKVAAEIAAWVKAN